MNKNKSININQELKMYKTYIKNTDSLFGWGDTEEVSLDMAIANYLEKYPEEENNIDNVEWAVQIED